MMEVVKALLIGIAGFVIISIIAIITSFAVPIAIIAVIAFVAYLVLKSKDEPSS